VRQLLISLFVCLVGVGFWINPDLSLFHRTVMALIFSVFETIGVALLIMAFLSNQGAVWAAVTGYWVFFGGPMLAAAISARRRRN
jgi:hypothetical protein